MKLNLCHFYPDILNLSGDRGNLVCLERRLEWRGIAAGVTRLTCGQTTPLSEFDLLYIGGGENFAAAENLEPELIARFEELREAAESGMPILAVCGGFELLGRGMTLADRTTFPLAGVLNMETVLSPERIVGDFLFEGQDYGEAAGFENHCGRVYLSEGLAPLGRVVRGSGNNGADGTEGARRGNVFGTFAQGPLLPKNPALADLILAAALVRKFPDAVLEPLDNEIEDRARAVVAARIRAAK